MKGFDGVLAPYASTIKDPDACVLPKGLAKPMLVVESGWSESLTELHHDRDAWLNGSAATTEILLILKWSRLMDKKVMLILISLLTAFERSKMSISGLKGTFLHSCKCGPGVY